MNRITTITGACGLLASTTALATTITGAEPTKANGDFIAGSGINASGFAADTNGQVTTYVKARGRPNTGYPIAPLLQVGDTFTVLSGTEPGFPTRTWWNWDFQFSPRASDAGSTTGGLAEYGLGLFVDTDPTGAENFAASVVLPLFDADTDLPTVNFNSWDDTDGFAVNPGPGAWSDDSIDYVYTQSWRYEFVGVPAGSLPPGDYSVRWSAYADPNATATDNPMVSSAITVRVIDASVTNVTLDAQDACLSASESQLVVEINLANAQEVIQGGQFFLTYDNALLDFVSADPAGAFGQEIIEIPDEPSGKLTYAVGVIPGNPGSSANGPMAVLTFDVLGDFCASDGLVQFDNTGVLPNRLTDDSAADISGASLGLTDLGSVTKDSVPPVLSLPSDIAQNADAGLCTAQIDAGLATASDACADPGAVTVNFSRSDSAPNLDDPFPQGTTTITWTAEDACGNTTTDTQSVTVDAFNTMLATVELQGTVSPLPFDRCITFELTPAGGGVPVVVEQTMTFTAGVASAPVDVPCGDYECITARDTLHTLRSTDNDDFMIVGSDYVTDLTSSGDNDVLVGGNLNDDAFIDILDFGTYIGQFGTSPGADTPCGTPGPHADISGDGDVLVGDFTFIQINFLEFAEMNCSGAMLIANSRGARLAASGVRAPEAGPVTSITVGELRRRGLGHMVGADLNADGVLDTDDMWAFVAGDRPDALADVNGDGVVNLSDLRAVAAALRSGESPDVDRDGASGPEDLRFVIDRLGTEVAR